MAWTKFPESPDLFPVSAGHEATGTRVPFTHWKVKVTWMSVSDISALLRFPPLNQFRRTWLSISRGGPLQKRAPLIYHYFPFVTFSKCLIDDNRWATKWPLVVVPFYLPPCAEGSKIELGTQSS